MGEQVRKSEYEEILKRARRRRYKDNLISILELLALFTASLLAALLICSVFKTSAAVKDIEQMQTDTLNQIMDLRREVDYITEHLPPCVACGDVIPQVEEESPLAAEERELVARVVAAEARGESYEGQLAVAEVIKCRSLAWGMTPTSVVLQDLQFAAPYDGEVSDSVYRAVDAAFAGESAFGRAITHFHASYIHPNWADQLEYVGTIGTHKFYCSL